MYWHLALVETLDVAETTTVVAPICAPFETLGLYVPGVLYMCEERYVHVDEVVEFVQLELSDATLEPSPKSMDPLIVEVNATARGATPALGDAVRIELVDVDPHAYAVTQLYESYIAVRAVEHVGGVTMVHMWDPLNCL